MSHDPTYLPHEHEHADSWHRHTTEEGSPQAEHAAKVDPMAIFVTLIGMAVVTVVVSVIAAIYFFQHTANLKQELRETTNSAAQQIEYRADTMSLQDDYAWEDAEAGTVHIPISQAMERVVEEYQRQEARRDDG